MFLKVYNHLNEEKENDFLCVPFAYMNGKGW